MPLRPSFSLFVFLFPFYDSLSLSLALYRTALRTYVFARTRIAVNVVKASARNQHEQPRSDCETAAVRERDGGGSGRMVLFHGTD